MSHSTNGPNRNWPPSLNITSEIRVRNYAAVEEKIVSDRSWIILEDCTRPASNRHERINGEKHDKNVVGDNLLSDLSLWLPLGRAQSPPVSLSCLSNS